MNYSTPSVKTNTDENKIEPSIYRYVIRHTRKEQLLLILLILISMPFVYVSLEIPKIIINSALSGVGVPEQVLGFPVDQIGYLLVLCFAFLLMVLINGGLKYLINVYRGVVGERMLRRFRYDLFSRLLRFPLSRFKQVSQAEIIPMVTAETEPLGGFIGDAFALPAFQGGLLITYLFFIFNQDLWLGLMAVALYPPQLILIPKLQRRINELSKQRVKAVRKFADKTGEAISGVEDIHVNDTSHFEKAHASNRLDTIFSIRFDIYRKKFFIKFLNNFLAQATPFFFYTIGGYFVITGKLTLGALIAVLAAYKDLASPFKELLNYYQITQNVRVKYKQIIDQFQPLPMLNPDLQEKQEIEVDLSALTLKAATVSYSEDDVMKSLDGISFTIEPGRNISVLGKHGSGRGILSQLLVRLLQPSFGTIKFAEHDMATLSESILGQTMAYVDSKSHVFTGTVRENLLYGLKHNPVETETFPPQCEKRSRYIHDAKVAANSTDDIHANWVNISAAGFSEQQEFEQHVMNTLKVTNIDNDVYQFGMYSFLDEAEYPQLVDGILQARHKLRQGLQQKKYSKLVEVLDERRYNTNMSVVENLIFGMPAQAGVDLETLTSHPHVVSAIEAAGLTESLFRVGLQTARIMEEMFSDVPEGSPLLERFSFISIDDLPDLKRLAHLPDDTAIEQLPKTDIKLIMRMAFRLTVARHRLGLITTEIRQQIVKAHQILQNKLRENNDLIKFYDEEKVSRHLTIQDNILFGRIAYGQANARQEVGKLIQNVIHELGLTELIIAAGLCYPVGVNGAKLTRVQRQKLTIARALIKRPKILVINDATAIFGNQAEQQMIGHILDSMENSTVIWVLSNDRCIDHFDHLLIMENGCLVAEGSPEDVLDRSS